MSKQFLRVIKIAGKYKFWMLLASVTGFLTIGSSIGLMMTSAYIIAKAALHPSIAELQVGIVGVRFFGIARGVFRYAERYISHEITFKLLARFRVWFYDSIYPLFPSKLGKYRSADLLTRIVDDVENLEHIYVRVIAPPFVALLVLILMLVLFGSFNLLYATIIIIFFLLAGVGVPLFSYFASKNIGTKLVLLQSRMNELIVDQIQGLPELLVFGQVESFNNEFDKTQKEFYSLQRKNAKISGATEALIGLLMSFAVITILYSAIPNVTNGLLDGVYLSVLVLGTMASFEALLPLPVAVQFLEQSNKSASRIFELTDTAKPSFPNTKEQPEPNDYSIKLKSVSFKYSGSNVVYDKLNLFIPQNKLTAIVGASGAGKSTLVNLITRFWDYDDGEIYIGNKNLRDFSPEGIAKIVSVVPQRTHLFNLSIKENIRFANPAATDEQIYNAAELANIHEFVLTLPNKYDELVGEQGLKLSGGERRRIALARAFVRNSPNIILDEPTADLDQFNEEKIMNNLHKLSQTHTVLIITHRLRNLDKAGIIYVMDKGQIVESGTHEKLTEQKGYYFTMLNLEKDLVV